MSSFDLQRQNFAAHLPRFSAKIQKIVNSELQNSDSNLSQYSVQSKKNTALLANKIQDELHISKLVLDSKIYALKKRLFAPAWWIEGLLLSLGTKEAWFDSLISSVEGKKIAVPSGINAKNITVMFNIWHETLSSLFSAKSTENQFNFQLNKLLSGTQKDIYEQSKKIEELWSTPLKLFEVKVSKKCKSLSLSKVGSFSIIKHVELEKTFDSISLKLDLVQNIKDVYLPQSTFSGFHGSKVSFISINPVVIQSMGKNASIKKILNYLFLEYSKQKLVTSESSWNSFHIYGENLNSFHKDILSRVSSFYDHGVLGWNLTSPNIKISSLKEKIPQKFLENNLNSIVYCWQLSDQAKEAVELENELSAKFHLIHSEDSLFTKNIDDPDLTNYIRKPAQSLFPEPPPDELKKVRREKILKNKQQRITKVERIKNLSEQIKPNSIFDYSIPEPIIKSESIETPKIENLIVNKIDSQLCTSSNSPTLFKENLSDNEFIIMLSEFYESLKPLQKKSFERERASMPPEQFRLYMTPILERKMNGKLRK